MPCQGGGVCLVWGGVCLVPGESLPGPGVGCLPRLGVSAWSWGCLPGPGGSLPGPRGCLPHWGVCLVRGVWHPSMHSDRHPPHPPVDRHTCKNITLATTSLRLVKSGEIGI